VQFGVLGLIEARTTAGEPVPVPGVKVRALLAALLARRGQVVSVDALVRGLWADGPPAGAKAALQSKVSQLRGALERSEAGAGALVESTPAGYRLKAAPDAVDADRFRRLTAASRDADPAAAADLLGRALSLWRGDPYGEFGDTESARIEVNALAELRLTALTALAEHAEARLALGQHTELVGELAALVEQYPLRERFWASYLRALYRSGRAAEASSAFHRLRRRLRDELGLDPSPELVRLHQELVAQDPALDAPVHRRARTNLAAPLTSLVGRDDAVTELRGLLTTVRLLTLTGSGGVGKTRLAMAAATAARTQFPDGVWLVELAAATAVAVAETVAAVLGVPTEPADTTTSGMSGIVETLVTALRGQRLLLILDNSEHVVEPVAALAGRLLRTAPELRILATTREPLGLSGEQRWPVPPLAAGDATRLFIERAVAVRPGFEPIGPEAEQVAEICHRLDGLPLAIELVAARLRAMSVGELAGRLDDRFRVLGAARGTLRPGSARSGR
jgi:DNA-binding SARP family transcriptional activator